jgi:hypothetical protein
MPAPIEVLASGSFKHTLAFLTSMTKPSIPIELEKFAQNGVDALKAVTPRESGLTAESWRYEIVRKDRKSWSIFWSNSHMENGIPIAVLLQYGHGTGTGGYVAGRDYINPALKSVFNDISDTAWKVVTSA